VWKIPLFVDFVVSDVMASIGYPPKPFEPSALTPLMARRSRTCRTTCPSPGGLVGVGNEHLFLVDVGRAGVDRDETLDDELVGGALLTWVSSYCWKRFPARCRQDLDRPVGVIVVRRGTGCGGAGQVARWEVADGA